MRSTEFHSILGPEAASFAHQARHHGPEPCTELPGHVLATGRGSYRSRMPVQGTTDKQRLVLLTCLARPHAMQLEWPWPRNMLVCWQIASMRRCVYAQGDFSCVWEMLIVEVVSEGEAR